MVVENSKPCHWSEVRTTHGRCEVECKCPFCETQVFGYWWSICGSGKKCPTCGALLCSGLAFERVKKCKKQKKEKKGGEFLEQQKSAIACLNLWKD